MDNLFLLLFFTSIIALIVGLIKPTTFTRFLKDRATQKDIATIFGIAIIIFLVLFAVTTEPTTQTPQVAGEESLNTKEGSPLTNPSNLIKNAINSIGNYEITTWTLDGNLAGIEAEPPFEIIVNTSANQIRDCFDAKNKLFDVMKAIYTNDSTKDKVVRIKFTAWGQLKASLGTKDTRFDWDASGPSNFWKVLQQYKSYEDETGILDQRTYGVRINSSCK